MTKRIKEVINGRENWKNKYRLMKIERDEYAKELQQIKKYYQFCR